ncbi:AAA domain-containing protein [Crossiella sp. CA-258035]|uniref:AAA domain-containing protein n=1 Tax=Crossiella sp. CA-258035 TaxID=2981138 RepID=UPI0024BD48AC|nr:AAA domain-containing protein [Crossiella sp. CA-258035]WHT22157.1 AAA domain-containing protein [Crossiella sp. CA-258035]
MAAPRDREALNKTTSLMNFLAEVTDAAERHPVRDILSTDQDAPDPIIWLDELPDGVRWSTNPRDDVLMWVRPPRSATEPAPPEPLAQWVDLSRTRGHTGPEPVLHGTGPADAEPGQRTEPPNSIVRAFSAWRSTWRAWARDQSSRTLYEQLEKAAKTMEQQDDEFEFVLAVGLVAWAAPDGDRIYRHLVTEPVRPTLDRATAEVTVSLVGGKRRLEGRELFADQEVYRADRGRSARQDVLAGAAALNSPQTLALVRDWLAVSLDQPLETRDTRTPAEHATATPVLSPSPALLLRPRSRVLLAEAYRRIAEALRQPGAEVQVALAQLVVDTEPAERSTWLQQQGAASGDVLGTDPLFPLPTNDEQQRVIELLRTETSVVVQGPPGTGKTHTIANLVSALLARGQRVLVTSQKDQALKVLRGKIPAALRELCVLLAGGSKDAAKELQQSLDALSEAIASPETSRLPERIKELSAHRHDLRSTSAQLNSRIRELRGVENVRHGPVAPGYSTERYCGTLSEIVREVKDNAATHRWFPPVDPKQPDHPPLTLPDLVELLRLTRSDGPARRARDGQRIPERAELPAQGGLAELVAAERTAQDTAHTDTSELTQRLAAAGTEVLHGLRQVRQEMNEVLHELGLNRDRTAGPMPDWVARALGDRFAGRHAGLWGHLSQVREEAHRLQERIKARGVTFHVELTAPISTVGIGKARGLLKAGHALRDHLAAGRKLRKVLPKSSVQKEAADFLAAVAVDGRPPTALPELEVALEWLEAEVAATQLVHRWAEAKVPIETDHITDTLSQLDDSGRLLGSVEAAVALRERTAELLRRSGLTMDLSTIEVVTAVLDAAPAALNYVELERARTQVDALLSRVREWAGHPDSCGELGLLVDAIANRDLAAYDSGLHAVDRARTEQDQERRRAQLARVLHAVHPQLLDLLEQTASDQEWDSRIRALPDAWAWSKAEQFVSSQRNADEERQLVSRHDEVEDLLKNVTEELAAAEAMHACVARMTDSHVVALRSYREHMGKIGGGHGSRVREFRNAAKAAMEKAKSAVPAWVVPLPNLLENIAPDRDSFDVVIVDEASQVGLEHLFLLWMAPRVIVVGDDKQCTPGVNRMGKLANVFERMSEHLAELPEEVRFNFSPKSNLYGLLSARSGKDAVVRLREHFRCMPEIINWSSEQFYGAGNRGLVPLRERTARDLEPLQVVHVTGAYPEGKEARLRNPVEAKRIVEQLVTCLADPRYRGKSFGVVVLRSLGHHVKLIEHEINAAITPEEREARNIRVGTAPNFQGDERDVIFLSTVVTEVPQVQAATMWQQTFNVAASRARDQMWLFTSVRPADYRAGDLRASLVNYMLNPPSVYGASPELDSVSERRHCKPFESLFEQRLFRRIRERGYHVVPQFKVGTRSLDLVVVGDGGRLAVECDGHRWHASAQQQVADARRDRELRRMGWEVVRIRESEFEFDAERGLAPLWQRLAQRDIHPKPVPASTGAQPDWTPIELPEDTADAEQGERL